MALASRSGCAPECTAVPPWLIPGERSWQLFEPAAQVCNDRDGSVRLSFGRMGTPRPVETADTRLGLRQGPASIVPLQQAPTRPSALRVDQLVDWITRIAAGDEKALACLHERCASRVFAAVLRIVRRHQFAEEVVGDCFWQVWREAARFDGTRGSAMSWILAIARSRAIDAIRRDGVSSRHETALDDDAHEQARCEAPAAADALALRRRDQGLRTLMTTLDPAHLQLLWLAFFDGLSHQEIADHSGLPLGTVKSTLRRSMAQLRGLCMGAGVELACDIA